MSFDTDCKLVSRVRNGEIQAYGDLVNAYQNSVFNVCYRFLGNREDSEDLAQETFVRAYQRLGTYDISLPFGPWIRRIATNLCLNFIKREKRYPDIEIDDEREAKVVSKQVPPEIALLTDENHEILYQAICGLPLRYKLVIELQHFQGLTYKEMAQQLGLPINTVKSHLFRARLQLAKTLRESVDV